MKLLTGFLFCCLLLSSCDKAKQLPSSYESELLQVERLTDNTFLHVSYLNTESFGKVGCNGMIVINNGEALIYDTPVDDQTSEELVEWVEGELESKVVGVVATHFHVDCIGGIRAFHRKRIPSYANHKTIELAVRESDELPQNGFQDYFELAVGNTSVINHRLGEGHTKDNIIAYFPDEKIIFGGCLIKSLNAGKGNLADANVSQWSSTVQKIKSKYADVEVVIPGHGKTGGPELLDYTIKMFLADQTGL